MLSAPPAAQALTLLAVVMVLMPVLLEKLGLAVVSSLAPPAVEHEGSPTGGMRTGARVAAATAGGQRRQGKGEAEGEEEEESWRQRAGCDIQHACFLSFFFLCSGSHTG